MSYTLEQKNQAITAFLGGPAYLREKHFPAISMMEDEFALIGPEDLKFHSDWNWIVPAWTKIRTKLPFAMVVPAISAIDIGDILALHEILSGVCIIWCKDNGVKL